MDSSTRVYREFRLGILLTAGVQAVFMGGGLWAERLLDAPVTGVPSLLGLSVLLAVSAVLARRMSPVVLLGSFSLAVLSPVILFAVIHFRIFPVSEKLAHFSLGYMCALIAAVWFYLGFCIVDGDLEGRDDEPGGPCPREPREGA